MTAHRPTRDPAAASALVVPLLPHAGTGSDAGGSGGTSFITELAAAVDHLEQALELGRTPTRFLLPNGATVTEAQLRLWVAQHTARAQAALSQITPAHTDAQR
ncbi:hypothetical protein JK359_33080 [Streptomyces actinomycinicus]|uniref:Uncharacterized protein n=1 Tax=Streptomyces actinomycinicus TaxID=1695166 RepID=A0A937JRT4_9ACTN|nr:hypothetical protein [Streptomyces actinomycinicus]MBL1086741.1 hypothetical protein [Streptomyces actinomycinicus]